jgi:hypothetical protein
MADILDQILAELDAVADAADKLRADARGATRQTDLEVAILTQQIADLREKNARAGTFIDDALAILGPVKRFG